MPAPIDLKDCVIKLLDGTGTPNELTVKIGEGNFTWSEMYNREYKKDRGNLDTVRNGDQEPMEVSFEVRYTEIKAASGVSFEDFLKQINGASAYASTDSDACAPYAVDIQVIHTPPHCTTQQIETLTFPDFRVEKLDHDIKAGTISCSGKCNAVQPTVARTAQE